MDISQVGSDEFVHLEKNQQICLLTQIFISLQSQKSLSYTIPDSTLSWLISCCFERSLLPKYEMHLYQKIILLLPEKQKEISWDSLFLLENTNSDWDIHFLVCILRQWNSILSDDQWLSLLKHLLKQWDNKDHCLCHLLERFLRVIEKGDSSLYQWLLQYCNIHTKRNCKNRKYYYKLINHLLLLPSFSSYKEIHECLVKEEDLFSPWYLLAYFYLSQVSGSVDCTVVFEKCSFEELLSVISEKDTIMIGVVTSLLLDCLKKQNPLGLYFFSYLLKYYDSDVDLFISMLDESPDVLLLLTTLCKLINLHLQFTEYTTILSFLDDLNEALIHLEKSQTLSVSLQPLINRISYTVTSFVSSRSSSLVCSSYIP